ncbi:MAG: mechanosensitive ion channel family protein [Acidobacteriota bacterium]
MASNRYVLALLVAFFAFLANPVPGQEGPEEVTEPRPEVASPRATLTTFLSAFKDDNATRARRVAAATLDLSDLPAAARELQGADLAVQLKDVIDRTEYVDLAAIPDDPSGPPWSFLERGELEITLERQRNGEWLFNRQTVASIPALWRASEGQEIVEGVTEAPRTLGLWVRSQVPPNLRRVGFLLEHWQWLGLLLLAVVGPLLARLVATLLGSLLLPRLARWFAELDAPLLGRVLAPARLLVAAGLWRLGLPFLGLPPRALGILKVGLELVALVALIWFSYRAIDVISAVMMRRAQESESRFDDLLAPLVRKASKVVLVIFGTVFVADNLEIDVSSLLAGIGLGGLALALAAQDTVKNLFGSITVLLDQPFHVGDAVSIGDVEGTVEEVGMRSTRVRTFYNSLVTVPNANLISASVDNFGARQFRRWKTTLGVEYGTSAAALESFCEGIRDLIRQHPATRKEGFYVHLNEFGDSSLNILLYVFFETSEWAVELEGRQRLMIDIIALAERLGIEFAFPTRTLHLASAPAESPLALPAAESTD